MDKKNCIIYSNCQGYAGVRSFLELSNKFVSEYNIKFMGNYDYIENNIDYNLEDLKKCDLFIYQPLKEEHGMYSTMKSISNSVINKLNNDCITISFPYMYEAFITTISPNVTPHLYDLNLLHGEQYNIKNMHEKIRSKFIYSGLQNIYKMIDNGCNEKYICDLYDQNKLDFDFEKRYTYSFDNLRSREKECDIIVSDYIEQYFRTQPLFLTQNHPSSYLLKYVTNKILSILDVPEIDMSVKFNHPDLPTISDRICYDDYNYNYYGLKFDDINGISDFDSYRKYYEPDNEKTKNILKEHIKLYSNEKTK